jgi:hypothetical protein
MAKTWDSSVGMAIYEFLRNYFIAAALAAEVPD